MLTFIIIWLLIMIICIKCVANETQSIDEKIIEIVCEQVLETPNEALLEPNLDLEGLTHILEQLYANYFTPESFKNFIQLRYGDKYHVVATEMGKWITLKTLTITEDPQTPSTYHFEAHVDIEDPLQSPIPIQVLGHTTLEHHKITHITFLDTALLEALTQ